MKISIRQSKIKKLLELKDFFEKIGDIKAVLKILAIMRVSMGDTIHAVADYLRELPQTISKWILNWILKQYDSLASKRSTGRPRILGESEEMRLKEVLTKSPTEYGFFGGCWTSRLIARLINQLFNKVISYKYVPEVLKRLGYTYQKGTLISSKQNPVSREYWIKEYWPKLLKKAKFQKSEILFADESGICLSGHAGYSWAPSGQRPKIESNPSRKKLNLLSAIGLKTGVIHASMTEDTVDSEVFIGFLKSILRERRGKVEIVLDNASYHKSEEVQNFVRANQKRLKLHYIPPYSPDLNPIEGLWSRLKCQLLANLSFPNMDALKDSATNALRLFKASPNSILNLFKSYQELIANS